jgi:hypothetical protein
MTFFWYVKPSVIGVWPTFMQSGSRVLLCHSNGEPPTAELQQPRNDKLLIIHASYSKVKDLWLYKNCLPS